MWVHTVCKNDFKSHKQMTKQTTIVVIGSLRVKPVLLARNLALHSDAVPNYIQSNLNGSNIFGTMEIRSRHG